MENLCGKEFLTGPFDECLDCQYLKNGCSGPRTNAMDFSRWLVWIKAVMKKFDISNRRVADNTPLSKSTVDDILAGRRKDISRETTCYIENYVLGNGKWPCAKKLAEGSDVVYEDRPETLEMLKKGAEELAQKDEQLRELKENFKNAQEKHEKEVARLRQNHEDEVEEYKELVAHMRVQVDRKDDYIDRLAKKAGI